MRPNLNFEEMRNLVNQGYVSCKKHPQYDLWIWNYTAKASYAFKPEEWSDSLSWCRGLVTDANDEIIAIPFKKFWNIEQHSELPKEPFQVFDKIDGSLGIIFRYQDDIVSATRGSFESHQAIKAKEFLSHYYPHFPIDPGTTYLCEIIYPENRIVCRYDEEGLVLLAAVCVSTGIEMPLELYEGGMPLVQSFSDITDPLTIRETLPRKNAEGFVLRFEEGLRVKIKYEEYTRLHRLLFGMSNRVIWEMLKNHQPYKHPTNVPQDFARWVDRNFAELQERYRTIENECQKDFEQIPVGTRKEAAAYITTCRYPGILFKMLDRRPYEEQIWKLLEPKWEPFRTENEDAN